VSSWLANYARALMSSLPFHCCGNIRNGDYAAVA
jgi:hypothetical protein